MAKVGKSELFTVVVEGTRAEVFITVKKVLHRKLLHEKVRNTVSDP